MHVEPVYWMSTHEYISTSVTWRTVSTAAAHTQTTGLCETHFCTPTVGVRYHLSPSHTQRMLELFLNPTLKADLKLWCWSARIYIYIYKNYIRDWATSGSSQSQFSTSENRSSFKPLACFLFWMAHEQNQFYTRLEWSSSEQLTDWQHCRWSRFHTTQQKTTHPIRAELNFLTWLLKCYKEVKWLGVEPITFLASRTATTDNKATVWQSLSYTCPNRKWQEVVQELAK